MDKDKDRTFEWKGTPRMNYSFMTFSTPDLDLEEVLAVAERYGYDGIEPRAAAGHHHGIELETDTAGRIEAGQRAADSGIAICCIATSCRYANPETAEDNVDATLRYIDLAADVGCPRIRVFGGAIPDGVSREQAVDLLSESLASVAEHAAAREVTVCLETHDHWCDPKDVALVMTRVNHAAIGVNWDIMHPVRVAKTNMDDAFETLKPWIRHLHVHDGVDGEEGLVLKPIGDGIVDHPRALELLLALGYEGFISGEWIKWEPYETHLPRELATLKQYEMEMEPADGATGER